jgi:D-3-phosphoglycerate dehydrogenase
MKKTLIIDHLSEESLTFYKKKWLSKAYSIIYLPEIKEMDIAKELSSGDYDALIVRNKIIDRNSIKSWANAKQNSKLIIVRAGSNISTIDVNSANEFNIEVKNTPGANSSAVAQHIITQLLILSGGATQTNNANHDVNNNIELDKRIYASHTLSGDTLALIGTGAIGSKVAKIANSLGMHVKAYSPGLTKTRAQDIGATYCQSIQEAVTNANFISVQVPFTLENTNTYPKTYSMINNEVLNLVNDGAKLISVSRRDVINIADLSKALEQGKLSSISFDLLQSEINELKASYPSLFGNPNNIITPLIACESYKADMEIANQSLKKVEEFFEISS